MRRFCFAGTALTTILYTVLCLCINTCSAHTSDGCNKKVIMVIANRVSVEDLLKPDLPNINSLIKLGTPGLMTVNIGEGFTDNNAYATIGFGKPAIAPENSCYGFNTTEKLSQDTTVLEIYHRLTGYTAGKNQVVLPFLPRLVESNQKNSSSPGALAESLSGAGKISAVIGNSDGREMPNRPAVLIAMNAKGQVPVGNVSKNLLQKEPESPYGIQTNYQLLQETLQRILPHTDLVVVETGDTFRADMASEEAAPHMQSYHKKKALEKLDKFIGSLLPLINNDNLVILVSPLPGREALLQGKRLSPVILAGGKITPGGILTSPTTRRPGLVANFDLTATVLDHLGVNRPAGIIGLPAASRQAAEPTATILKKYQQLVDSFNFRPFILNFYINYQVILLIILVPVLLTRKQSLYRKIKPFLMALLIFPAAFLILPLLGSHPLYREILHLCIILLILTIVLLTFFQRPAGRLIAGVFFTATVIVGDIILGGQLIQRSYLGYDAIMGGRFYGIGNEYMGVLIGTSILLVSLLICLCPRYKKQILPAAGLFFGGLVFFFASPNLGTNAGGTLAAATGYSLTMLRFTSQKVNLKAIILLTASLLIGIAALITINTMLFADSESHIGRVARQLLAGNFEIIIQFIQGKLGANWHLIITSNWTIVFVLLLVNTAILFRAYRQEFNRCGFICLKHGFAGITAAGLAALFLNDSGIIAVTTMQVFVVIPAAVMIMENPEGETTV